MAKSRSARRKQRRQAPASTQPPPPEGFPEENPNRPREYHGRRTMFAALGVIGAVVLALWLALGGGSSSTLAGDLGVAELPAYLNESNIAVRASADSLVPDFELETLDGDRFRFSDFRGHPVILNFWASWCGPCRRETPVLVRLADRFRDAGLIVIGVNIEESRGAARGFAEEFGVPYELPMDFGGGVTREFFRAGAGPPHTFFIRADGTIRQIFVGQAADDDFERFAIDILSDLTDPLGPGLLPGPKALPTDRLLDDREVGTLIGELAPDFILATDGGRSWRLSERTRLGPVLLAFAPPDCRDCDSLVGEASQSATASGVDLAVVAELDAATDAAAGADMLVWREDVGRLLRVETGPTFVLVGANGVIVARGGALADVQSGLSRLSSAAGEPVS